MRGYAVASLAAIAVLLSSFAGPALAQDGTLAGGISAGWLAALCGELLTSGTESRPPVSSAAAGQACQALANPMLTACAYGQGPYAGQVDRTTQLRARLVQCLAELASSPAEAQHLGALSGESLNWGWQGLATPGSTRAAALSAVALPELSPDDPLLLPCTIRLMTGDPAANRPPLPEDVSEVACRVLVGAARVAELETAPNVAANPALGTSVSDDYLNCMLSGHVIEYFVATRSSPREFMTNCIATAAKAAR